MPATRAPRAAARALALAAALAAGCADYAVTFNERPVYTPPGLFRDYAIADEALRRCVAQHVVDQSVQAAGDLSTLDCGHAGIASIAGLEVFTGLTRVRLSANAIADVSPLADAAALEVLLLDDNRVADPSPLWQLEHLARVDLGGNGDLRCPAPRPAIPELVLPAHCP